MEPIAASPGCAGAEAVAKVFMASGTGEEAFGQRAQIEASSAGDDGEFVAAGDVAQSGACLAAVFAGSEGLVGIGNVDEVMRNAGALFGRWVLRCRGPCRDRRRRSRS